MPRTLCNQLEALLGLLDSDEKYADEFLRIHEQACRSNDSIDDGILQCENARYLDLWLLKFAARRGESQRAASIIARTKDFNRWPELLFHRYYAEAVWSDFSRAKDERLPLARQILAEMNPMIAALPAQSHDDLIYGCYEGLNALILHDAGLPGWSDACCRFLSRLQGWQPTFCPRPPEDPHRNPREMIEMITTALRRFPY